MNTGLAKTHAEDRQQFWEGHVRRWQSSGKSLAAYCREHGLKYSQLNYYKKRGVPNDDARRPAGKLRLVPLKTVSTSPRPTHALKLSFDGMTIEVSGDFCMDSLSRLIKNLRMAPC